ncbi:germination protein YpeB [Alkalihalobacillus pseudalcaliphilus]|uniref:germination protein YpeB n=1 Tax=Alkalihalobacillus pseudalcaliphilus TaxID=79884 RepID=UPI00064DB921|nr:germination protein YpeB [Alkalihalobacillus pseudalcaliphilus]KMK76460.1 sporulation protein [Alkalihalobacillus pseudalcaliphilus]
MVKNVIIGLLSVALIATGYWAFQEQGQKNMVAMQAENNYQRAFHDLTYHLDQIEDQLGATLAMSSRNQLSPSLAEVWRVTSLAQEEMGQLPLTNVDIGKTEEFLYNLSKLAYRTSIRDLDDEPLTDKEYENLENLYHVSKDIRQEMRQTQAEVLADGHRWLDIEKEMVAQYEPKDNTVLSHFEVMNKTVEGYSELEWGPENASMKDLNGQLKKALKGKRITKEEAKDIASKYLDFNENATFLVEESGDGLEYEAYSLSIDDPHHKANYYMDISVHGGHPIWFMQARDIGEVNVSLNEASKLAQAYLEEQGFENMQLVNSEQYDSIAMLDFVYVQDDYRIYPDSLVVEVALDEGDIIGYEAKDYLINHKEREIASPKLTKEEAMESLNEHLEVMEDQIGLIQNDLGEEVLCYEFYALLNDETYRIFINADNGDEEKVERMPQAEVMHNYKS